MIKFYFLICRGSTPLRMQTSVTVFDPSRITSLYILTTLWYVQQTAPTRVSSAQFPKCHAKEPDAFLVLWLRPQVLNASVQEEDNLFQHSRHSTKFKSGNCWSSSFYQQLGLTTFFVATIECFLNRHFRAHSYRSETPIKIAPSFCRNVQGGSNMTGTDCGLFTHKSVPVIFEPPCI